MKTKSRSEFELFSENQNKEYAMHYMEHHPATDSLVYVTIGDRVIGQQSVFLINRQGSTPK